MRAGPKTPRLRGATRIGRLIVPLVVALCFAPGTWVRSPLPGPYARQTLHAVPLPEDVRAIGSTRLAGAWELRSQSPDFHGYSALAALADGSLLALSDRGRLLRFGPPDLPRRSFEIGPFSASEGGDKHLADIEAMTIDPQSGRLWTAYEGSNVIERRDRGGVERAQPAAMRNWPGNTGPEAMVRLTDGRFIVLSESPGAWFGRSTPGLLFPGDPIDGVQPLRFRFMPPDGFRPVDIAQVPDGRVLILVRRVEWGLPPGFATRLVLADPKRIAAGMAWRGEVVADIAAPAPTENFEGLAVVPRQRGGVALWLISDDNQSAFQRTLLLKLLWRPNEKARETSRAPT
jgi:hypothetical protein